MNRGKIRIITIFLIGLALTMSALGGMSDLLEKPIYISKEHAWRDASFVLLLAILLNVMI